MEEEEKPVDVQATIDEAEERLQEIDEEIANGNLPIISKEQIEIVKTRCLKCNSAQTYTLKNKTRVCRKCGNRELI